MSPPEPPSDRGAPPRVLLLGGFLVLLLTAYLTSIAQDGINSDAHANSAFAWHLAHTASPFFDADQVPELKGPAYFQPNAEGRTVVGRTPGQALLAAPLYLGSSPDLADFTVIRGSVAAALMTAGAMVLLLAALLRLLPWRSAVGVAAVAAFTTPVWSVSADQLWTHCTTILGLCGAAHAASRSRWWAAGAWLGLGILARPHLALVALVLGLGIAWSRRSPRIAVQVGAGSGAGLVLLTAYNRWVFGSWSVTSGYAQRVSDIGSAGNPLVPGRSYAENMLGFLVAPDRGLFVWTPLLLLLVPALVRGRRLAPDWTWWLLAGGVAYSLVQLALNDFTGGHGFDGYRLALELLVCAVPVFAVTARRAGRVARAAAPWLVGYQAAMIVPSAVIGVFYVTYPHVWEDNSVLKMLRTQPIGAGIFLFVIGVGAGLAARWSIRRSVCTESPIQSETEVLKASSV